MTGLDWVASWDHNLAGRIDRFVPSHHLTISAPLPSQDAFVTIRSWVVVAPSFFRLRKIQPLAKKLCLTHMPDLGYAPWVLSDLSFAFQPPPSPPQPLCDIQPCGGVITRLSHSRIAIGCFVMSIPSKEPRFSISILYPLSDFLLHRCVGLSSAVQE